jgi:hypothetical protein
VYRKEGDTWQRYEGGGGWGDTNRPTPRDPATRQTSGDRAGTASAGTTAAGGGTVGQLDRDRAARTDGATRTRDAGTYRSGGGSTTTRSGGSSYGGSYRPSGGGSRGGGMRGGGGRRR